MFVGVLILNPLLISGESSKGTFSLVFILEQYFTPGHSVLLKTHFRSVSHQSYLSTSAAGLFTCVPLSSCPFLALSSPS